MLRPKVALRLPRTASTSEALLGALAADPGLPHGTIFWTDHQISGRGQGSNTWHATPGDNLTCSVLLRPDHLTVDRLFALTQACSLALLGAVAGMAPLPESAPLRIKWPNDLYAGDRKLAGLLIQNGLRGRRLAWSIVGIGLNVHERGFPAAIAGRATSLRQLSGKTFDLATVRRRVWEGLMDEMPALHSTALKDLDRRYHDSLYLLGRTATFLDTASEERFTARVHGVGPDGRIRLLRSGHGTIAYDLRQVRLVAPGSFSG